MSHIVHWLNTKPGIVPYNGNLACGRHVTLYPNGERPLYAILAIPKRGYRWCKQCLRQRREANHD